MIKKQFVYFLLLCTTIFFSLSNKTYASEPLKIAVITDLHYLSNKLMDDGYAIDEYMLNSGRAVKYTPALLDSVLNFYDDGLDYTTSMDILLVSGDITKDGERESHLEVAEKLKKLHDKNVKVFVIPGNHDINMPNSVGFVGNKSYKTPNISPSDFADIYSLYGYGNAIERDTASLSYVAELSKDVWLLAIDAARYKEYTTRAFASGKISPQTEEWIVKILDRAKEEGKEVMGMMHWGLVEHINHQSVLFADYLVNDWKHLASLFADKGMRTIFTGHFHVHDVTTYTSPAGNTIHDVATGALVSYPFSFRTLLHYPNSLNISTNYIQSLPQNPNLSEENQLHLKSMVKRVSLEKIKKTGFDLSDEEMIQLSQIITDVFLLHMNGDEVMTEELEMTIRKFADLMGDEFDTESLNNTKLDFLPEDNNLTITF